MDRKKIRRWAKWVALILAIVFALSFLFMGVGYGGAGFDLSAIFRGGGDDREEPQTTEEKLAAALKVLETNPNDTTKMLEAATLSELMYGEKGDSAYLQAAADLMESAIQADPGLKEVYLRLANLYLSKEYNNAQAAVTVLNKATSVDSANPDLFLKLGIAQNSLGNTAAAVMAWEKYLELAPNGEMADVVREQVKKLTATTTTTVGTTSTTTSATSTTTD
ncbi:MAG: hypothetical protein JXA87_08115 [Thermoleophilia bacterium]|nr:hypothetical protein [Thermoleophilia bacterium]